MVAEKMHCRSAAVDTGRPSSVRSPSRHPRRAGASFIGMTMPQTAREVAPWVETAARIGYVAKALLYATVGILAAQAALGRGGRTTDLGGALREIGGEVGGIQTPVLKIQGLESVANSFVDAGAPRGGDHFGYASDFGLKGISLEIPQATQLPPEVQQLLQIVNQATTPINEVVDQVVQLLTQVGGTIRIPGLGSLGLGTKHGKTTAHSAESSAYALKIEVDSPLDGSKTVVELGRATSRISDPVPSGVFRTTMSALSVDLGGLLSFGGVSQTSIPCEGTGGNTRSKTIKADASRDS